MISGQEALRELRVLLQQLAGTHASGLAFGAIYALIALGYTMVYGVLQLINFAHSEVFMYGTFAMLWTVMALGGADADGMRLVAHPPRIPRGGDGAVGTSSPCSSNGSPTAR